MVIVFDMVIDADFGFLPQGKFVGRGWQWFQGGLIHQFKQFPAAFAQMFHFAVIEIFQQFPDRLVEFQQAEKLAVAQPGQNPPFHVLDTHLNFGLVARPSDPGWNNRHPIMFGHFLVGDVDFRIIPAGMRNPRLEIVWHDHFGDPAKKLKGADMTSRPIGQVLMPLGFRHRCNWKPPARPQRFPPPGFRLSWGRSPDGSVRSNPQTSFHRLYAPSAWWCLIFPAQFR